MNNQTASTFPNETPQLLTPENKDVFINFLQNHVVGKTCPYTYAFGDAIGDIWMVKITAIKEGNNCIFVVAKEPTNAIATFQTSHTEGDFQHEECVCLKNKDGGQLLIATHKTISISSKPSLFGKEIKQIFIPQHSAQS